MNHTIRATGIIAASALVSGALVATAPSASADDVNVPPVRTVTSLIPQAIDVTHDGAGNTYTSSFNDNSVTVHAKNANGAAAPLRKIKGAATGLAGPEGVAIDKNGFLYVANVLGGGSVREFAPGADGNVAPANTFNTGTGAFGLALDGAGRIYIANGTTQIRVFSAAATGNPTPLRTITGAATGLANPLGVYVDASNVIWVANGIDNSVLAFAPSADGNEAPFRTIKGAATGLSQPRGITTDAAGRIYVSNAVGNTVTVFDKNASGNVAPIKTLGGVATGLSTPWGVDRASTGDLMVVNANGATASLRTFKNLFPAPPPVVKVPSKPRALKVSGKKRAKKRTVSWKAPASNGGAKITGYRLVVKKGSKTLLTKNLGPAKRSFKLKRGKLRNGTNVVFLKAKNKKGFGKNAKKAFRVRK